MYTTFHNYVHFHRTPLFAPAQRPSEHGPRPLASAGALGGGAAGAAAGTAPPGRAPARAPAAAAAAGARAAAADAAGAAAAAAPRHHRRHQPALLGLHLQPGAVPAHRGLRRRGVQQRHRVRLLPALHQVPGCGSRVRAARCAALPGAAHHHVPAAAALRGRLLRGRGRGGGDPTRPQARPPPAGPRRLPALAPRRVAPRNCSHPQWRHAGQHASELLRTFFCHRLFTS